MSAGRGRRGGGGGRRRWRRRGKDRRGLWEEGGGGEMGGEVGMFGEKKRKDARDAEKKRRGADAWCRSGEGRTWVERGRQTRAERQ
jgi:hypothetical protein